MHGDARLENVLLTAEGLFWLDFEAVCIGPLEWDLVGLPEPALTLSPEADRHVVDRMRLVVSVFAAVWCFNKAAASPAMLQHAVYHVSRLQTEMGKFQ